ncbi:YiiD C-terminal domain-containing protein [Solimonas marina]|uniref:DUF4442 domain-containing protein n=1 Tax=Solimonas marina TaxID=2714601 RepID=A0A970B4Z4_9GAMM|nr:YiiD C-terminal domain-containing protein [Solimonas marina]NKF21143.1 DUF4442 domain-containing protein [Solimonas marina]
MSAHPLTPESLTRFLHEQIPLCAAMALEVQSVDERRLVVHAPLAPNRNPHGTVFGGSLATLGIVAGWTLLYRALAQAGRDAALVIQHYDCDYLAPAAAAFEAEASLPDDWPALLSRFDSRGRMRCDVPVVLRSGDKHVLSGTARYVARR